jgi:hypothetical protein
VLVASDENLVLNRMFFGIIFVSCTSSVFTPRLRAHVHNYSTSSMFLRMLFYMALELFRFYTNLSWSVGSQTQSFDIAGAFVVYGWVFYIPDAFLPVSFFVLFAMHGILLYIARPRMHATQYAKNTHSGNVPNINDDILRRMHEMEAAALHNRRH